MILILNTCFYVLWAKTDASSWKPTVQCSMKDLSKQITTTRLPGYFMYISFFNFLAITGFWYWTQHSSSYGTPQFTGLIHNDCLDSAPPLLCMFTTFKTRSQKLKVLVLSCVTRCHIHMYDVVIINVVFIAGKPVWSIPERFGVVCIPCKALYKCSGFL